MTQPTLRQMRPLALVLTVLLGLSACSSSSGVGSAPGDGGSDAVGDADLGDADLGDADVGPGDGGDDALSDSDDRDDCPPGTTYCQDGDVVTCDSDRQPVPRPCPAGCSETGGSATCPCAGDSDCTAQEFCSNETGSCQPQVCTPDVGLCDGGSALRCDSRGAVETRLDCPSGSCVDGSCGCADTDECFPGELCGSGVCECDSDLLCGERNICCDAGDVCVTIESCEGESCESDDRCLPPCDDGTRCGAFGELCCSGATPVCSSSNACVPDCGEGVACGNAGATCCPTGDVCAFDECRTPGAECDDFLDCELTEYCEPLLGRCLPNDFPPGLLCQLPHDFDPFDPAVEWHWEGVTLGDTDYANVLGFPAVADMNGDSVPDVIVQAYDGLGDGVVAVIEGAGGTTIYTNAAEVIYGAGHVGVANVDGDAFPEVATTLDSGVGLIDDIVNCPDPTTDDDGCYLWTYAQGTLDRRLDGGAPLFVDFNGDGAVEVVFGSVVLDAGTGTLIADGGTDSAAEGGLGGQYIPVAADVDGDGVPELLTGDCAWEVDFENGELDEDWCNAALSNGFPGVADIVESPAGPAQPEVIVVEGGEVFILRGDDGHGSDQEPFQSADYLYRFDLPGGGHGGPPNIADFDGDGRPEIGTAGTGCYAVFDVDCAGSASGDAPGCDRPEFPACETGVDCLVDPCPDGAGAGPGILWAIRTNDDSSETTGSSVFDLQGDGRNEVLYNDECRFLALDGRTAEVFLVRSNSSRTNSEYPIVVDVNGDQRSEILLVANNDAFDRDCPDLIDDRPDFFPDCYPNEGDPAEFCTGGTQGLFAFGDPNDRWVRTRPIWNQHAYAITNVGDDATVPTDELHSWELANTFRANLQGSVPLNSPDPAIASFSFSARACPPDIQFVVVVANHGTRGMDAGVPVSLYRTDGPEPVLIETRATTAPVFPGGTTAVTFAWTVPLADLDATMTFRAVVNDDGTGEGPEADCQPGQNEADLSNVFCRLSGPKD